MQIKTYQRIVKCYGIDLEQENYRNGAEGRQDHDAIGSTSDMVLAGCVPENTEVNKMDGRNIFTWSNTVSAPRFLNVLLSFYR